MATYETVKYSFAGNLITALQAPNIADGSVTNTEFQTVDTSTSIQTQLNTKFGSAGGTFTGNVTLNDNIHLYLGTGGSTDLDLYMDGSNGYIKNSTGNLNVNADSVVFKDDQNSINMFNASSTGAFNAYHNNALKFSTAAGGVTVTGTVAATSYTGDGSSLTGLVGGANGVDFNDNVKARFGDGNDLQIWHDTNNSYIKDDGTGDLIIQGSDNIKFQNAAGADMGKFISAGAVELYHNGSKKAETVSGGLTVTGTATATTFSGSGASLTNINGSNISSGTIPTARLPSGGIVRQISVVESTSNFSTTSVIPFDATTPTSSEGIVVMSHTFTPTSASSKMLHVLSTAITNASQGGVCIWSIFDGTTNVGAFANTTGTNGTWNQLTCQTQHSPNTTSAISYTCRFGVNTSRGHWLQTNNYNHYLGAEATWTIYEIA